MAVPLLPPPLFLSLPTAPLEAIQANLMPFHIDYAGPAPIDAFLVLRDADPPAIEQEQEGEDAADEHSGAPSNPEREAPREKSLLSAFRGRAIQSTHLPLPRGYVGVAVRVLTQLPSENEAEGPPAKRTRIDAPDADRRKLPPPPPKRKMQKFSMDSDSDDDDDVDDEDNDAVSAIVDAPPSQPSAEDNEEPGDDQDDANAEEAAARTEEDDDSSGVAQVLHPLATLVGDGIRVWGPDGPVDRGDDVYFRTVHEWIGVVGAELHRD